MYVPCAAAKSVIRDNRARTGVGEFVLAETVPLEVPSRPVGMDAQFTSAAMMVAAERPQARRPNEIDCPRNGMCDCGRREARAEGRFFVVGFRWGSGPCDVDTRVR